MNTDVRATVRKLVDSGRVYLRGRPDVSPTHFASQHYQRHNQRRQEHLASLRLPTFDRTVLELGAGVGDHTGFFLDRGCDVTTSDARAENVEVLRTRYPNQRVLMIDLDADAVDLPAKFDVVYCYGVLYHLGRPARGIEYMARQTHGMLLLETCVSFGDEALAHLCIEDGSDRTQAVHGTGCRPTRPWVFQELARHFKHVYMPLTQPSHPEFPLDWRDEARTRGPGELARSVFIASHSPIDSDLLMAGIPVQQSRA